MRRVNLNGVYYDIVGDVIQRPISPWKPRLGSGGLEYSDFSQAEMEEYHDFRGGIGLESSLPSESNRVWWNQGVDITSSRSAVLGPLVSTAGTFGATPIKILDFQGSTYAFGNSKSSRWNTTTSAWDNITAPSSTTVEDCEDAWDESTDAEITASVDTDDKKVGSGSCKLLKSSNAIAADTILATEVISKDLTSYTQIKLYIKCNFEREPGELQLLLDDNANCASPVETLNIPKLEADTWKHVTLNLATPASCGAIISIGLKTTVRLPSRDLFEFHLDDIKAHGTGHLTDVLDACVFRDDTDEYLVVSTAETAIYSDDGETWTILSGCKGLLCPFINKLYSIDVNGKTVHASPAKDIDGEWTTFNLSGDFGTIHKLFAGKLLADQTPSLYFCGTKGLFSLDTTSDLAYPQEIRYPPLENAGRCGMYFNASLYVSTGGGITKITPSMATPVGPDQDDGLPTSYQGDVYDMIGVNNWIVYCVTGGTYPSILKRHTNVGGNIQVHTGLSGDITCLHHSPSSMYTNGRLWFGEGTSVKYCMFPDTTSNVKKLSTYTYLAESSLGGIILPLFRKLAAINKVALGMAAITQSCGPNDYVYVMYRTQPNVSLTELGSFKSSPRPTILTFNSGLGTEFYRMEFQIKLKRTAGTTTDSPELESLMFYWIPVTSCLNAFTFRVACLDEDADATIAAFEAIRDTATLVTFYPSGDTSQDSFTVKLSSMPLRFYHEEEGGREGWVEVTVEEIFKG